MTGTDTDSTDTDTAGTGGTKGRGFTVTAALVTGAGTAVAGLWPLAAPRSFADAVGFPVSAADGSAEHFLHDVGAFQLGIAAALLLACVWYDALATALAGFFVAGAVHAVNHAVDLDHGGQAWSMVLLAVVAVAVGLALGVRLRQLGWVVGGVSSAARPELAPYVRQKTVLLTTYRRDGGSGSTPVSVAVDGEHAYIRSFATSVKTRRLNRDPRALLAPCTTLGKHPGAQLHAQLRRLERGSAEDRRAAKLLSTKYPCLHGVLVPFMHRTLMRRKVGHTVHFEVTVEGSPRS
ncbi:MAG TPA: PPOX class F420-dependent oxidoreductase [Streptomyces sp.]|jgi:PPOX class probable F420-dependent enzyme|nr:PPOX class F420-dependent oxidoreductase [Streptomyces sp.]